MDLLSGCVVYIVYVSELDVPLPFLLFLNLVRFMILVDVEVLLHPLTNSQCISELEIGFLSNICRQYG